MIYRGHYINGKFQFLTDNRASKKHTVCSYSPADLDDLILQRPMEETGDETGDETGEESTALLNSVFENGKKAWLSWSQTPLKTRVKKLYPLKKILKARAESLTQIIARETGKPLWESRQEVMGLLTKTDFMLGEGLKKIQEQTPAPNSRLRFKSRGLLVVLGPFNFPLHLPYGQILPALVAGNALIFKPSEKTPASGQKLAECFEELDLLPGLFQMLQGGARLGMKLATAKATDGLLFTGSFKVGQKLKEKLIKDHHKILALEMGGLNSTLIWEDADLDRAVPETLKGCFQTAGQRCSSTRQILLHKKIAKVFIQKFVEAAKELSIGHYSQDPFMGPVIDQLAIKRFLKVRQEVCNRGGKILLDANLTPQPPLSGGPTSFPLSGGPTSFPLSGGPTSFPLSGGLTEEQTEAQRGGNLDRSGLKMDANLTPQPPLSGGPTSFPLSGGLTSFPLSGGLTEEQTEAQRGGNLDRSGLKMDANLTPQPPLSGGPTSFPLSGGLTSFPLSGGLTEEQTGEQTGAQQETQQRNWKGEPKRGYYVQAGIYQMPKFHKSSFLTKEECFTPQVLIYELEDLTTALDWINHSGYGLVLSIWTQNKKLKEELFHRARVGLLNWNLSTIGASPLLPFGGLGKSGNDRAAGSFAFDFCTSPLAERAFLPN